MMKKFIMNFAKIILIFLPIIVFIFYFCITFWGNIYILNVNQMNIPAISEALQKDNIKFDNLNKVHKIDVSGAGLNNFTYINFYDENNYMIFNESLIDTEHYYIEDYLKDNSFNISNIANVSFITSIFISLSTISISIYKTIR